MTVERWALSTADSMADWMGPLSAVLTVEKKEMLSVECLVGSKAVPKVPLWGMSWVEWKGLS